MAGRISEIFTLLHGMAPKKNAPKNSPSNARSQHTSNPSNARSQHHPTPSTSASSNITTVPSAFRTSDIISLDNTPINTPTPRASSSRQTSRQSTPPTSEYDIVERPPPDSPSMDVNSITLLPWGKEVYAKWQKAVDLTTDYENIDADTLTSDTAEPRPPKDPLREPKPLREMTDVERHTFYRSAMYQVVQRADFWFKGVKHLRPQCGIVKETQEFVKWRMNVQHDVRFILDFAGTNEEGQIIDKTLNTKFFKTLAEGLLVMEEHEEGIGMVMEMEVFQKVLAYVLVEVGVKLNAKKFKVFLGVEDMVKRRKVEKREARRAEERATKKAAKK